MRFDAGFGRLLKLAAAGLLCQGFLTRLAPLMQFPAVFLAVYIVDNMRRVANESSKPLYVEEVLSGVLAYVGFGFLAYGIESLMFAYTAKRGGAAVPAVALALVDKAWPTAALSNKRG